MNRYHENAGTSHSRRWNPHSPLYRREGQRGLRAHPIAPRIHHPRPAHHGPHPTWAVRGNSSSSAQAGDGTEPRVSSSSPRTSAKRHWPATPSLANTCRDETGQPDPKGQTSDGALLGGGVSTRIPPAPRTPLPSPHPATGSPPESGRSLRGVPPSAPRSDTAQSSAHTWLPRSPRTGVPAAWQSPRPREPFPGARSCPVPVHPPPPPCDRSLSHPPTPTPK